MPPRLNAIPTYFDDYQFRSRLEARWAVVFKDLNIPYEYEPEGYNLNGTYYLPDFWLPFNEFHKYFSKYSNPGFFIEIKPNRPPTDIEIKNLYELQNITHHRSYFFCGTPGKHTIYNSDGNDGKYYEPCEIFFDYNMPEESKSIWDTDFLLNQITPTKTTPYNICQAFIKATTEQFNTK